MRRFEIENWTSAHAHVQQCCKNVAKWVHHQTTSKNVGRKIWPFSDLSQQHATCRNMLCPTMLSWNVEIVWPGLRSFSSFFWESAKVFEGSVKRSQFGSVWTQFWVDEKFIQHELKAPWILHLKMAQRSVGNFISHSLRCSWTWNKIIAGYFSWSNRTDCNKVNEAEPAEVKFLYEKLVKWFW